MGENGRVEFPQFPEDFLIAVEAFLLAAAKHHVTVFGGAVANENVKGLLSFSNLTNPHETLPLILRAMADATESKMAEGLVIDKQVPRIV